MKSASQEPKGPKLYSASELLTKYDAELVEEPHEEQGEAGKAPKTIKKKIAVIGDSGVGKRSLVKSFAAVPCDGRYLNTLGALVGKYIHSHIDSDGQGYNLTLMIWDITGIVDPRHLGTYLAGAEAGIVVASAINEESIKHILRWKEVFAKYAGSDVPTVIAVTHMDGYLSSMRVKHKQETSDRESLDKLAVGVLECAVRAMAGKEDAFFTSTRWTQKYSPEPMLDTLVGKLIAQHRASENRLDAQPNTPREPRSYIEKKFGARTWKE